MTTPDPPVPPDATEEAPDEETLQAAVGQLAGHVTTLLARGQKPAKIVEILVSQGWDEETARTFVGTVERTLDEYRASPAGQRLLRRRALRNMVFGGLWLACGITLAGLAAHAGEPGFGAYLIAGASAVAGGVQLVWGAMSYRRHRPR